MKTRYLYLLIFILAVSDLFIVNLVYLLTFNFLADGRAQLKGIYMDGLVVSNLVWLVSSFLCKLYTEKTVRRIDYIYSTTLRSFLLHFACFACYIAFFKERAISREFLLIMYGGILLSLFVSRFVGTLFENRLLRYFKASKPVAVLGMNKMGLRLAAFFEQKKNQYEFNGFLDDHEHLSISEDGRLLPLVCRQIEVAAKSGIQEVYVPLSPENMVNANMLLREGERQCVRMKFVPDLTGTLVTPFKLSYMEEFPVISMRHDPLEEIENRFKKRIFDIIFSLLVIVFVLSWLYPIIGIIIKLQSPGPILFKQKRDGRNNQTFYCYKFRSMKMNSESDSKQATKDDDRITAIGKFIRRTSLDELPQFFNVLLGDMSVVGPRPHILSMTKQYREIIDQYMVRHFLKSGITGWAQVNGLRGETKDPELMRKRVEHDVWYLENWSIMLDLRIVIQTVINMIRGEENAY
ncbi:undecaprenyl-phosphate glucose phosphotransferase [Olivibacter domesticus]|uniref:Putative colanic acid biosysnthesis UDP-glucose lipid carrier transferase n=1 Tax=Olivibacter domesticus TaxID=407022 RepID=A0A1H7YYN0_OLID1|nr:undecaprenyl-phosphate glucose phosphotransferase [Olivibacter domesticus]SEM50357.1 putative colanic acid biosysnthesis UDP-glucose lipid carrier transferase [Olivibacter domesticus]